MVNIPKIFVGTMYSDENEFTKMLRSLNSQININIEHFIVSGKSELEASKILYERWMSIKDNFDAFVQLDPDTIIRNDDSLYEMFLILKNNEKNGYNSLQCALYDWLTMSNIFGLNMYLPTLEWVNPTKEGYADRSTIDKKLVPNSLISKKLSPVGDHCLDPHYKQAFHFGLQRGIKNRSHQHVQLIQSFIKTKDDRRAMASLGFEYAKFYPKNVTTSYFSEEFKETYINACKSFSSYKELILK